MSDIGLAKMKTLFTHHGILKEFRARASMTGPRSSLDLNGRVCILIPTFQIIIQHFNHEKSDGEQSFSVLQ